jgi:replicative DNA helicase
MAQSLPSESRRPRVVAIDGRTPPHDLEAEAAVLSAIMVGDTAFDECADLLKPEHFFSEAHRRIFEAAMALREAGSPTDVVLVATWLRDRERLAQVGGIAYLTELLNAAPHIQNARPYAEIVRDKWLARQVILVCQKGLASGFTDYGSTAIEYLGGIQKDLFAIGANEQRSHTRKIAAMVNDAFTRIRAASASGRSITGLSTGFDRYDRMTAGLHDGELTIIAGRPGMGKTSLALQMGTNIVAAKKDGDIYPNGVVFFSCEMPHEQVAMRMLAAEARVDVARLRTGMIAAGDWSRLTAAAIEMGRWPLWVDDKGALTLVELRAKLRRCMLEAQSIGATIRLVIVDYLQLMKEPAKESFREQEVSAISQGLKNVAKEYGLPVIAISQLNRDVEKRAEKGKRPQLSDLRESGAIEQDADNIVFVYRDDYYNRDSPERGIAELGIAKQRNGPTDTVKVRFDSQYTRFDNMAEGEYTDD